MSKISVIVPVYKVEPYLDRCVQSILNQSFTDFELILIDDGSPDNCPAMCDEYAKQDERVVVLHQQNSGLSAARNAGIDWAFANSDSEWLTFIDSDDWIHEEYLERLYQAVTEHGVDISVCGFERTEGDEPIVEKDELLPVIWTSEVFYVKHSVNAVVAWGKLYKKELFKSIRYPVGKIHEDEFTTHKLLFQCENIAVIHAPLYAYFVNEKSITANGGNYFLKAEAYYEKLIYFDRNNFENAKSNTIKLLPWLIHKAYADSSTCQNKKTIRRIAKKFLIRYAKSKNISFKKNAQLYEIGFPCIMWWYWTFKGIVQKF